MLRHRGSRHFAQGASRLQGLYLYGGLRNGFRAEAQQKTQDWAPGAGVGDLPLNRNGHRATQIVFGIVFKTTPIEVYALLLLNDPTNAWVERSMRWRDGAADSKKAKSFDRSFDHPFFGVINQFDQLLHAHCFDASAEQRWGLVRRRRG